MVQDDFGFYEGPFAELFGGETGKAYAAMTGRPYRVGRCGFTL
jgi:hypothetical protein